MSPTERSFRGVALVAEFRVAVSSAVSRYPTQAQPPAMSASFLAGGPIIHAPLELQRLVTRSRPSRTTQARPAAVDGSSRNPSPPDAPTSASQGRPYGPYNRSRRDSGGCRPRTASARCQRPLRPFVSSVQESLRSGRSSPRFSSFLYSAPYPNRALTGGLALPRSTSPAALLHQRHDAAHVLDRGRAGFGDDRVDGRAGSASLICAGKNPSITAISASAGGEFRRPPCS